MEKFEIEIIHVTVNIYQTCTLLGSLPPSHRFHAGQLTIRFLQKERGVYSLHQEYFFKSRPDGKLAGFPALVKILLSGKIGYLAGYHGAHCKFFFSLLRNLQVQCTFYMYTCIWPDTDFYTGSDVGYQKDTRYSANPDIRYIPTET